MFKAFLIGAALAATTLAQAQKDTGHLPRAPRAPMGKAVEAGTDMGAAIPRRPQHLITAPILMR